MPPIVTGNFNITSSCTINNTIKRIPYLEAVRNSFACKSKNTGIPVKRHSMTMLSFRKTEILVIDKIRSFVLGSKSIYTIPTFSKCFFNNFLPIKPPIMAQIIVPKIIRGINPPIYSDCIDDSFKRRNISFSTHEFIKLCRHDSHGDIGSHWRQCKHTIGK